MSDFSYRAMNPHGRIVHGRMEAANPGDLELRLHRLGLDLVHGTPVRPMNWRPKRKISRRELINFCFHLEQFLRAGVPIIDSLADLRERIRGPRFWVMLAIVMVAAWWCFPPASAGYRILSMNGGERGFYSSAWVGMVLAMVYSSLLSLGGFYVIRGTLVRDIETRVWQLLVATPMTRGAYLLAKWASHLLVLAAIAFVGLGVGLVAQWLRAEDRAIDLIELMKPVLVLSLPGLAVTAMLAIWFDLLPWLRRTIGNVVFFILWIALTSVSLAQLESPDNHAARYGWGSDPNGMIVAARDFQRQRLEELRELLRQQGQGGSDDVVFWPGQLGTSHSTCVHQMQIRCFTVFGNRFAATAHRGAGRGRCGGSWRCGKGCGHGSAPHPIDQRTGLLQGAQATVCTGGSGCPGAGAGVGGAGALQLAQGFTQAGAGLGVQLDQVQLVGLVG